jgi:hypothetical protein
MQCLNGFKVAMQVAAFSCTMEELEHMQKIMMILRTAGCNVVPATEDDVDIVIYKEKPKTRGNKADGRLHVHESWILSLPIDGSKVDFPDKEFLVFPADVSVIDNFETKMKEVYVRGLEAELKKYKSENENLKSELAELRKSKNVARVSRPSDTDSEAKRCKLRADLPSDVKNALVECYGQYARGEPVPTSEPGDTEESVSRLIGNSRLYRYYKANAIIRRFFGANFPNCETFRKNYNQAVAAIYQSANPNQPRAQSESSDASEM